MELKEIFSNYALNDGEILAFEIDFLKQECFIKLNVNKHVKKQKFQKCDIGLHFKHVTYVDIAEDFRTSGGYSDITFIKTESGKFYLSLDPFGNTGEQNENDNFVVISESFTFVAESDEKVEVL